MFTKNFPAKKIPCSQKKIFQQKKKKIQRAKPPIYGGHRDRVRISKMSEKMKSLISILISLTTIGSGAEAKRVVDHASIENTNANIILDYKDRCGVVRVQNVGDSMESLVSVQRYRSISERTDRDKPININGNVMLNAWWDPLPAKPPVDEMNAQPVGMFVSNHAVKELSQEWRSFFAHHPRVGARDMESLRLFQDAGVSNAYFSGCPTSTLQRPTRAGPRGNKVLIIDVHSSDIARFPPTILNKGSYLTQNVPNCSVDIIKAAANRLIELAEASLVITSRLHVAMPRLSHFTLELILLIFIRYRQRDFVKYIEIIKYDLINEVINEA